MRPLKTHNRLTLAVAQSCCHCPCTKSKLRRVWDPNLKRPDRFPLVADDSQCSGKITIGIQVPKCCDTQFPAMMFTMFDQTGKTLHFIKKSKLLPGDFQIARGSLRLPPHREEVLSSGLLHYRGPWNDSIAPGASSVVWVRPADHTAVEAQCHKRTRQSLSTDKPGLDSTDVLPVSVTNSRTATGQQSIAEVANIKQRYFICLNLYSSLFS